MSGLRDGVPESVGALMPPGPGGAWRCGRWWAVGCLGLVGAETGSGATRRVVRQDRSEAEALDPVEHRPIIVGHEAMPGFSSGWFSSRWSGCGGVRLQVLVSEGAASPTRGGRVPWAYLRQPPTEMAGVSMERIRPRPVGSQSLRDGRPPSVEVDADTEGIADRPRPTRSHSHRGWVTILEATDLSVA